MNFNIAASTNVGISKQVNQDSFTVMRLDTPLGEIAFAALCDGMGGLEKGELASATVVDAYREWVTTRLGFVCTRGITDEIIEEEWSDVVLNCHRRMQKHTIDRGTRLGTTATVMMLTNKRYYVMNIGDTRAYEITDDARMITTDHVWVTQAVESGIMTPQQARTDKRRNVLTRCIGALPSAEPEFFFGKLNEEAMYMLCSDGFRHKISGSEMVSLLNRRYSYDEDAMKSNIEKLIQINMQRAERDNITAITILPFSK